MSYLLTLKDMVYADIGCVYGTIFHAKFKSAFAVLLAAFTILRSECEIVCDAKAFVC